MPTINPCGLTASKGRNYNTEESDKNATIRSDSKHFMKNKAKSERDSHSTGSD
jgi:hypothetical protein